MIDLSPDEFRKLGYRAVDIIAEQLASTQTARVRQPVPPELRESLMHQPLPTEGADPFELLQRVVEEVLPYPMGNNSPRFFGYVNSPPAPIGVLADMMASYHNAVPGGDHAATYVEHGVLNWIKQLLGYPLESQGILTSGGSVANLTGLAVMRHVKSGGEIRKQGFQTESVRVGLHIDRRTQLYTESSGNSRDRQ